MIKITTLSEAFGEQFVVERRNNIKNSAPQLKVVGAIKDQIIRMILENQSKFKSASPAVKYQIGANYYDIMLVDTQDQITRYDFPNGGYSLNRGITWGDKWISINSNDLGILGKFLANESYFVIGKLNSKAADNGKVYYSFRTDSVITMNDILDFKSKVDTSELEDAQKVDATVDENEPTDSIVKEENDEESKNDSSENSPESKEMKVREVE